MFFIIFFMLSERDIKKKKIIEMYRNGSSIRDIAKQVHMSFSDIGQIIRESTGQKKKEPTPEKSNTTKAFNMFSKGKTVIDVIINLDLKPEEAQNIYSNYLRLRGKCNSFTP